MRPASRVPASLEEMAATDFSMVQYLERFGGYGNARELGIVQYALSFVVDCALRGDLEGVREHSSLLAVALEQAAQDQNRWELAFQLLLLEDPPPQIWSYRQGGAPRTGRARAFSALCPQRWASVALAYTKEIDYLQNRRQEVSKAKAQPPAQPLQPQPKKKGKFPRKGGARSRGGVVCLDLGEDDDACKAGGIAAPGSAEEASRDSDEPGKASGKGSFQNAHGAMSSECRYEEAHGLDWLPDGGGSETVQMNLVELTHRSTSLHGWSQDMLRQILLARTSFSYFVRRCLHCCKELDWLQMTLSSHYHFPLEIVGQLAWKTGR